MVLKDWLMPGLVLQTVFKLVFVSKNTFLNSASHLALHICFSVWVRTSHACVYLLQESVFSSVDRMKDKVCGLGSLLLWVYPAFGSSIWMPLAQSKPCRRNMFRLAVSDEMMGNTQVNQPVLQLNVTQLGALCLIYGFMFFLLFSAFLPLCWWVWWRVYLKSELVSLQSGVSTYRLHCFFRRWIDKGTGFVLHVVGFVSALS